MIISVAKTFNFFYVIELLKMNRQHLGDQHESIWRDSNISFKARAGTIGYNDTTANNVVQTQITFLN